MTTSRLIVSALVGFVVSGSASADVLGAYEFTGGSLVATDADGGDGITLSDLNIHSYTLAGLTDNGSDGNSLRISGDDDPNSTGAAFADDLMLSFTVTNNSGFALNFETIGIDFSATNVSLQQQARVYSDQQGFDDVVGDTIGLLGPNVNGDSSGTDLVLLDGTAIAPEAGANTLGDAVTLADGNSITFYLPFNQDSNISTRFTDYDNLTISGSVVPEPGSLALLGLGGLMIVRRRRD